MNYRYTAVIATISNSLCDAVLDYAVNKFNYYKILLFTSIVAFLIQFAWGGFLGIEFTAAALPYIFIHSFLVLLGYVCFVKALEYLPLALIGLLETSHLFITLIIDAIIGYISITPYFLMMFVLFIFSIILFSRDCLNHDKHCLKNLKFQGFIWALTSVIFYAAAPYLIKISNVHGANEIAINLGYYFIAIPYFFYFYISSKSLPHLASAAKWWHNIIFLSLIIGVLESAYYILETFSFINDAPTIVMIIEQMRIFLIFGLSVLFKMDNFTIQKTIALVLGIISVIGIYYS